MHRTLLLSQLETHRPLDDLEKEHHRRMVAFVRARANCFDRALAEGHITGSAWIVNRERTAALLVHHKKLDRWLQPGGHADGDADPLRVAWREAREETGLQSLRPLADTIFDVDIHEIPARGETPAHLHYDVRYCFEADAAEPLTLSGESHALAWRLLSDILAHDEESLARMARKVAELPMPESTESSASLVLIENKREKSWKGVRITGWGLVWVSFVGLILACILLLVQMLSLIFFNSGKVEHSPYVYGISVFTLTCFTFLGFHGKDILHKILRISLTDEYFVIERAGSTQRLTRDQIRKIELVKPASVGIPILPMDFPPKLNGQDAPEIHIEYLGMKSSRKNSRIRFGSYRADEIMSKLTDWMEVRETTSAK